jgi:hypothetical protein
MWKDRISCSKEMRTFDVLRWEVRDAPGVRAGLVKQTRKGLLVGAAGSSGVWLHAGGQGGQALAHLKSLLRKGSDNPWD